MQLNNPGTWRSWTHDYCHAAQKYLQKLLAVIILTSCHSNTLETFAGVAMTVPYRIVIAHPNSKVQEVIASTFDEIDQIYNKWNPNSEISRLNQLQAHIQVPISEKLEHFLKITSHYVTLSGGRFDPTLGSGWNKIHFENGLFWKDEDSIQIDLGGIAKGYAIDLLVERLIALGHPDVFVDWGGEIRVAGRHPDNRPWRIKIPSPGEEIIVELENQAVASSGDYFQYWEVDGRYFYHITNPLTKTPLEITATSPSSVTVIASTCLEADAIATAGMVFDTVEESREWLKHISDIQFWVYKMPRRTP
jgi:thiamine biosynthesis lipoprotein